MLKSIDGYKTDGFLFLSNLKFSWNIDFVYLLFTRIKFDGIKQISSKLSKKNLYILLMYDFLSTHNNLSGKWQ